jgi:peroxiredoxin
MIGCRLSRGSATVSMTAVSLLLVGALAFAAAGPDRAARRKPATSDLSFRDLNGKTYTAADMRASKAVVYLFLSTQCPVCAAYTPRILQLAQEYGPKAVQAFGVYSNRQEEADEITRYTQGRGFTFPVVRDVGNKLADRLEASSTPSVVVVDGSGAIRYRGRIDDNQDETRIKSHDLAMALDAVLAGRPVPVPETKAFGCPIRKIAVRSPNLDNQITYAHQVSRILQRYCQDCHRPGEVAPFSLVTYQQASAWAQEIKDYTSRRAMPPWKAEPGFGEFANERRLKDEEISILARWADAGAPEGNPRDLPPPRQFTTGWTLGQPDLVLEPKSDFQVEASGADVYRCFVLPTDFGEDRWVKAVECRPGNRTVVHHVIAFLDTTGQAEKLDAADPGEGYTSHGGGIGFIPSGMLGGWAPGNEPRLLPPGTAGRLPAHARVVLQVHYHKSGKPETDHSRIGIYFAREPVDKQMSLALPVNFWLQIPPGAERHEVKAQWIMAEDAHAYSVMPHMHLLGREMKVTATLPDGTIKPLVWIKDWDFNWQNSYVFREPVPLPKGTKIEVVAYYDNSTKNPRNPSNPPKAVRWGEQTTDEMCIAFVAVTDDAEHLAAGSRERGTAAIRK